MKRNYNIATLPRMFEQVARQIADYIASEELRPGSKLPTERQLSELLEVSRSSVREGIRVLELLRLLDSKQGGGTFVSEPPPYLLPSRIINQRLEPTDIHHYYEVALMCAEKILLLSIEQQTKYQIQLTMHSFWDNLMLFITELGSKLPNNHFAVLWNDTFGLISDYCNENTSAPFQFEELVLALNECNVEEVIDLLNKLGRSLHL